MEIPFVKLQGNGNDFILIDETKGNVIPDEMKGQFAKLYCDRRFGIGGDGVLFISSSEKADIKMRLFQPDESEAEMCGNGIRCLVKYAYDMKYIKEECSVETLAGILLVEAGYHSEDEFFAVIDMGRVKYDRPEIPAKGEGEYIEEIEGFTVYAVNTGVPHAVVFVENLDEFDICSVAPKIRYHETFLEGANVNFVSVTGDSEIKIRTYERGVEDETFSCGTGSTASAVVSFKTGKTGDKVLVNTVGGPLTIYISKSGAKMEGSAETVFSGFIPL
ncbi:diaminopimelate epimerase [Methanoplanus sp. FWC-SCC4]|uniref:Diaminopimelate epimerase n=1 Tax=Methanochimaera problematica TaxID=2609417 RepID=A0AA97FAB1_9EURY|nr:diaminopimelate epimerase [Methanoplanus sp. FWC-SCC4]WOF15715.1 diaminopimelate epimerase [Methanoplanus sp. FWC-SCC4]